MKIGYCDSPKQNDDAYIIIGKLTEAFVNFPVILQHYNNIVNRWGILMPNMGLEVNLFI